MDFHKLLLLTLDIEGALRVLEACDSAEARENLAAKVDALNQALAANTPAPAAELAKPEPEVREETEAHAEDEAWDKPEVVEPNPTEILPEALEPSLTEIQPETVEPPRTVTQPNADLPKGFTVNDRYRFTAELFNGDSDDFNETVKLLASMPDMREVEDFLYGDLLWDASNPVVEEFIGIVSRYIPQ